MRSFQAVTGFVKGVGTAVVASGCAYLVGDAISDVITLRACHQLVLPLARDNQPLVKQLGHDLDAGPMFSSKMRSSPSGQIVQCQFRIDGSKRSSDVTATVQRPPYASTALYNLLGPALWDLQNCHVLIGKKFHLWTFDSNCTGTKVFFFCYTIPGTTQLLQGVPTCKSSRLISCGVRTSHMKTVHHLSCQRIYSIRKAKWPRSKSMTH